MHTPQLTSPTAVAPGHSAALRRCMALVIYPFRQFRQSRRALILTRYRERLQQSRLHNQLFAELGD